MDEELFNLEIRKLLKKFGVTAQREIEQAVRAQLERGTLTGRETLAVHIRMTVDHVVPEMTVDGTIALAR